MTSNNAESKLTADYEAIRRQEYELINDLLEVLPKIENLDTGRVEQVRDAMFHADHPYLMVFVGPFSSGKTSIINALLGSKDLLTVGVTPTTDRITILRWGEEADRMTSGGDVDTVFHPSPLLKKVSFVDTPGLESVFKTHEETTRKFLHRSDTVLMVMLATQAMSQRNLEDLQTLKGYGKNIIIAINQADLLDDEQKQTVLTYVEEQSKARLGYKPTVWLFSAKLANEAREGDTLDTAKWGASGFANLERYIDEQLGDVARLRQKLSTPLQIAQSANQRALEAVRGNQSVLDKYTAISENIDTQLSSHRRDQERLVRDVAERVSEKFGEAAQRGSEAIRDNFKFSRALGAVGTGTLELIGLGNLLRRAKGGSDMRIAFTERKAFEPIDDLPGIVDELAARLEGRDVQDCDDLVKYATREINALPEGIQSKVIGRVQSPGQYDRAPLQKVRDDLEAIENKARTVEISTLEAARRNAVLYLAVYEIILLLFGGVIVTLLVNTADPVEAILFLVVLGLIFLGLAFVPLRGRLLEGAYTTRMLRLQNEYIDALRKAADKQVAYGADLRSATVQPLVRLIESQTQAQTDQLNRLQSAQQRMSAIETSLTDMGKNRLSRI